MFGFGGKKDTYAAKWTSYHSSKPRYQGGFASKKNAQKWLNSYKDKGPESGVRGKVVKERMRIYIETVLKEDNTNETPEEFAKAFLPGGSEYGLDYEWDDIIVEVNDYFDRDFPITRDMFKKLTGITTEEYNELIEKAKRREELADIIDDYEWDIMALEQMLDDDAVRTVEARDGIIDLKIDLKYDLEEMKKELSLLRK